MGKNAYFCLAVKDDGVYVEIFPPKEDGLAVPVGELTSYLNARNLSQYDLKQLNDALNEKEKVSSVKVGIPGNIQKGFNRCRYYRCKDSGCCSIHK